METSRVPDNIQYSDEQRAIQLRAVCLDKALEAYKCSQQVGVLELAEQFEAYLKGSNQAVNSVH